MKTYLFPEVAGHGEITEWVPADVARELFDALDNLHSEALSEFAMYRSSSLGAYADKALKKACSK